ncbi:MAG: hypothetical protein HOQ03_09660 [Thermoleophilia bacterium]|nr:hypothetical protein [Thermoleophilia bacterium]
MTREQAQARAAQLNAEHPERASHHWIARHGAEGWTVARIALPEGLAREPMTSTTEARPRPPTADDPRPVAHRNIGGPYAV